MKPQVRGKCLDDRAFGDSGSKVVLFTCNGGSNSAGSTPSARYVLVFRHLCLDDPASSRTKGTPLDVWSCNNGENQNWSLPALSDP